MARKKTKKNENWPDQGWNMLVWERLFGHILSSGIHPSEGHVLADLAYSHWLERQKHMEFCVGKKPENK